MPDSRWKSFELIDFGHGRKLERWGELVIDRPSPAAEGVRPHSPGDWATADLRYERTSGDQGEWSGPKDLHQPWQISLPFAEIELQPSPFGHLGAFPEQYDNWLWIRQQLTQATRPWRILNLFAYTGIATLAAASGESEVVHVDASRSSVTRARGNAERSGLGDHHLRWLVEDVLKFCRREVKRSNHYDAIILDPPTYGHGPKGQVWQFETGIDELLDLIGELFSGDEGFLLFSGHSEQFDHLHARRALRRLLDKHPIASSHEWDERSGPMMLTSRSGRRLDCGWFARCQRAGSKPS